MSVIDNIVTPTPDVDRDRYGRPMVIPPGGGKKIAYTRCTTFVGCLEDTYNLSLWQQRMVALGLADRPDLLLSVAAHREDKAKLNQICADAQEAAKAKAGATIGTALHALTEQHDRGMTLGVIPSEARADIDAYIEATRGFECIGIEQFVVLDDLKVGGTFDRLVRDKQGRVRIADLKTGSVDYGMLKIAMQLAVYAHSEHYDPATGERTPIDDVDLTTAIVIHLPAGTGTCRLLEVDIDAGWQAVDVARRVRGWRAKNNLAREISRTDADQPAASLEGLITYAANLDELTALWREHAHEWTAEHTALAAARKAELTTHGQSGVASAGEGASA